MRWSLYISLIIISAFAIFSCVNNQKTVVGKENSVNMESLSANLAGIYSGNLPCVDCDAISTVLELHNDKSYVLRYSYEGKSSDQFVKEGSWSIDRNVLSLEGVDYKYKINNENLVQLDLTGNDIKGDLAEKYQLERIN
ncbi:MAG: copper resistance protein NlpE [Sphingobacterium composti]|uniref:copper resistance protein NlpE n=1 Tax=Sphingobacterium composti TaxID=363260 RepID=UPI001358AF36|nr:copper resistance protein NlpE [Sphingobacterium composti Ten et al. 2007 non Yoo et al. 2007]